MERGAHQRRTPQPRPGGAGRGTKLTEFHLLAGISACHAAAAHPDETDWARIVSLYDGLMEVGGGDVVRLNRAVAVGHANGPQQTLDALDELAGSRVLADYSFRAAARADACQRLGRGDEAHAAWQEAARLATNGPERRYYERRAADATDQPST